MNKLIIALGILWLTSFEIKAQGCSDAGFCSLQYGGSKSPFNTATKKMPKNSLQVEVTYGLGEGDVTSITPAITYSRVLNSTLTWNNKINLGYYDGNLGSNTNIGDLISTLSIKGTSNEKMSTDYILGFKVPFTSANDKIANKALPLAYQSSLGTVDLVAGTNVTIKKLELTGALQIPVSGRNNNSYFKQNIADTFSSTNNFLRRPDALLRAAYNIPLKNGKVNFKPNLLAVYHLGEDKFTSALGSDVNLTGSKGFTLNANIQAAAKVSANSVLNLSLASPLVVRKIRPDGLTRSFTATVSFTTNF